VRSDEEKSSVEAKAVNVAWQENGTKQLEDEVTKEWLRDRALFNAKEESKCQEKK
jgi:hypothetical protein